jgi:hypothetical protein
MSSVAHEVEELRVCLDRVRALLDNLIVRGLRACGPEEIAQLNAFAQDLERSGAGHVAGALADLREGIEKDDRGAARTLLLAQTSVRLLERLLTLRVAKEQYEAVLREDSEE